MTRFKNILPKTLLTAFLIIGLTACDDNPVSDDDHNEHPEPMGLILTESGAELARYQSGTASGNINVDAGEETAAINVTFIDEDGETFLPEDDGLTLDFEIGEAGDASDNFIEIEQHDGEIFSFHVVGLEAGSTTLTIKLMHNGHADFVTAPFDVTVN